MDKKGVAFSPTACCESLIFPDTEADPAGSRTALEIEIPVRRLPRLLSTSILDS